MRFNVKNQFFAAALLVSAALNTRAVEFEPLVDEWMISEEIAIGGPIFTDTVINDNNMSGVYYPKVASNGQGFLIVWSGFDDDTNRQTIYGQILDRAGRLIQGSNFKITTADIDWTVIPRVASNGQDYLVVWAEAQRTKLVATRIGADGTVLDSAKIEIRSITGSIELGSGFDTGGIDVESNGINYFIAWYESSDASKLYGVRLNSEGNIVDTEPILLAEEIESQISMSRASNNRFKIVTMASGSRNSLSAIVDVSHTGLPERVHRNFRDREGRLASIGYDGSNHLITWHISNATSENPNDLMGGIVTEGFPEQPLIEFQLAFEPERQLRGSVASDGNGFLTVWTDSRNQIPRRPSSSSEGFQLYGTRISGEGSVIDPDGLPLVTDSVAINFDLLASNRASYLLVYPIMADLAPDGTVGGNGITGGTIKAKLIINPDRYLVLSEPTRNTDGGIEFQFNAAPGHAFAIEHTENFSEWTELTRFDDFSGEEIVFDQPGRAPARFYRARRLVDAQ